MGLLGSLMGFIGLGNGGGGSTSVTTTPASTTNVTVKPETNVLMELDAAPVAEAINNLVSVALDLGKQNLEQKKELTTNLLEIVKSLGPWILIGGGLYFYVIVMRKRR